MSKDIRVLLVKLADRLHNMRTLHHVKDRDKRLRIARETMEIYAPLAERIGMQSLKDELEDLAFRQLHPTAYDSMIERLRFLREQSGGRDPAHRRDPCAGPCRRPPSRPRSPGGRSGPTRSGPRCNTRTSPSNSSPTSSAFRIVVDGAARCYEALGVVHAAWPMVPGRFKDYISTPKPNGYRSLHTTVQGPERQRLEIQIRSRDMHEIGEYGVAAHWAYKGAGVPRGPSRRDANIAGSASSWRSWSTPPIPRSSSNTPSWRCSRTRCSASRPRESSSTCRAGPPRSTSPMPCTPMSETLAWVPK